MLMAYTQKEQIEKSAAIKKEEVPMEVAKEIQVKVCEQHKQETQESKNNEFRRVIKVKDISLLTSVALKNISEICEEKQKTQATISNEIKGALNVKSLPLLTSLELMKESEITGEQERKQTQDLVNNKFMKRVSSITSDGKSLHLTEEEKLEEAQMLLNQSDKKYTEKTYKPSRKRRKLAVLENDEKLEDVYRQLKQICPKMFNNKEAGTSEQEKKHIQDSNNEEFTKRISSITSDRKTLHLKNEKKLEDVYNQLKQVCPKFARVRNLLDDRSMQPSKEIKDSETDEQKAQKSINYDVIIKEEIEFELENTDNLFEVKLELAKKGVQDSEYEGYEAQEIKTEGVTNVFSEPGANCFNSSMGCSFETIFLPVKQEIADDEYD